MDQSAGIGVFKHPQRTIGALFHITDAVAHIPVLGGFRAAIAVKDDAAECILPPSERRESARKFVLQLSTPADSLTYRHQCRHLVPGPPIKLATSLLLEDAAPLLKKERYVRTHTLVADIDHPFLLHWMCTRS